MQKEESERKMVSEGIEENVFTLNTPVGQTHRPSSEDILASPLFVVKCMLTVCQIVWVCLSKA